MSGVDVDALLAAVKRLGVAAPVFLDGERVSITEQDVIRLAEREAAVAELIEAAHELDEELDGPAIAHRLRAALARVGGGK